METPMKQKIIPLVIERYQFLFIGKGMLSCLVFCLLQMIGFGQENIYAINTIYEGERFLYSQSSVTGSYIRFTSDEGLELKSKNGNPINFDSNIKFPIGFGIYNGQDKWAISFNASTAYGIETPVRFFETISFGTLNILPDEPHLTAEDDMEIRYNADNDVFTGFIISKGLYAQPDGTHQDVFSINAADDVVVESGHVFVKDSSHGLILKSPNGSCFLLAVDNAGSLNVSPQACP